ncbi:MAG: hypothetical protein ACP5OZ_02300 [Candidatus Woesearchaeota archaeon]
MKLVYVNLEKINIRNYIPKENSAIFEIHIEDNISKSVLRERIKIEKAVPLIIHLITSSEELKNYEVGEDVKVIIQDVERVKKILNDFMNELKQLISILNSKDPTRYLDTLSRINTKTLNVKELLKEKTEKKKSYWEEKLVERKAKEKQIKK